MKKSEILQIITEEINTVLIPESADQSHRLTEARLARGLKPLLQVGAKITKKVGEDALMKLSDKFDRIDDEYAGDIASHLDMAIELMQDGYPGDATKKLKQFNKACKDVLAGKEIGSAFEGKVTEAKLRKGDIIKMQDGEYGVVNKLKGKVAYIKLDSMPGSFHPIEADRTTYKGKHKGKDLYLEAFNPKSTQQFWNQKMIKAKTMKDVKKLYPKAKKTSEVHGAVFYIELEKDLYAKAFSKNTMKSIEPFTVEAIYSMKGKKQTFLYREGKLTESMIGIETKANFKPNSLKGELERAGIKGFRMDRLTWSLSMLKLDSKDLEKAKKIIDTLPKAKIKMVKESKLTEASAKNKFGVPPMNKWWTGDKEALMSAIYHAQRQLPPTNKTDYEKNWKNIVNQLQKKYPAPTAIYKKRLTEATVQYNFSEDELKRVLKLLGRSASTEVKMIKAFEKAFGRKLTRDELFESSSIWKALDEKWKLYDESMDIENDLRNITATIKQLHKNMEQEAEPEGGKVADRYGREIEKYEKMYKKRKAEFKKVNAKIDKLEQY